MEWLQTKSAPWTASFFEIESRNITCILTNFIFYKLTTYNILWWDVMYYKPTNENCCGIVSFRVPRLALVAQLYLGKLFCRIGHWMVYIGLQPWNICCSSTYSNIDHCPRISQIDVRPYLNTSYLPVHWNFGYEIKMQLLFVSYTLWCGYHFIR